MNAPRPGIHLRAAWSAILSLIVPGLGHIYARTWRIGVALIVLNEVLSSAARIIANRTPPTVPDLEAFFLVILLSVALMAASATDAVRRVLRVKDRATSPRPRPRWFRSTWFAAILLLVLNVGIDRAIPFNWRSFNVPTASMAPSLVPGDSIITDNRPGLHIQRGDVVIFAHAVPQPPTGPISAPDAKMAAPRTAVYVKRVIGLPGDRVAVRDGRIVLNGTPLPWRDDGDFIIPQYMSFGTKAHRWLETLPTGVSYPVLTVPTPPDGTNKDSKSVPEITVPPGHVFVAGDNRDNSTDSRSPGFGTVPGGSVIGQARTIYWSQDRARLMTPVP
jgi:signal peptidase I